MKKNFRVEVVVVVNSVAIDVVISGVAVFCLYVLC